MKNLPWDIETDTDRFMANQRKAVRRYHNGESRPDQVFVFGSNLQGLHAGGAAAFAVAHRGAVHRLGQGIQPSWMFHEDDRSSYALPTMSNIGVPLPFEVVRAAVTLFKAYAATQRSEFFVTAAGTGIAGFTHEEIAPLFADAPMNCVLPQEWREIIEHG